MILTVTCIVAAALMAFYFGYGLGWNIGFDDARKLPTLYGAEINKDHERNI